MQNLVESFYGWYRNTLRNTQYRWLIVAGTLLYLVSPIDILPDVFPILGWIDDGIIATLLVAELSQLMTDFLSSRSKRGATEVDGAIADESETGPVIDVQVN
ncbi:MAG: YkvA family protein [Cyanobacteria bacterium P01_G01_bin.38]